MLGYNKRVVTVSVLKEDKIKSYG
ncbi:hypothetical protein EFP_217 [Enterococcus phage EF24C]|uniref:Uncharacterized protein n=1 Tax=Enterococcus phage phiEF24C TaxID=442493 RepID=A8E2R9_BPPHE|nr:hypothetical protein EFP_gp217 [Enterococcus phage EF24C]BAF81485.1 hypothetical protein EFP_217 [Enterococcus phage EF24C]